MIKRLFRIFTYLVALCLFFFILKSFTPQQDFSLLIQGGFILDGTGNPWFKADIGIDGKRIVKIGDYPFPVADLFQELEENGMSVNFGCADITFFEYKALRDQATFAEPHQYAQGLRSVIVNGQVVVNDGTHTGKLPGMIIYGFGKKQEAENDSQD